MLALQWYYNVNEYAFLTFMYTHGLLPQPAYTAAHTACGWADFLLPSSCKKDFTHPNAACKNASHVAQQYLPETWDPYNGKRSTLNELYSKVSVNGAAQCSRRPATTTTTAQ